MNKARIFSAPLLFALSAGMAFPALAGTVALRNVQVSGGDQVDLLFDRPVPAKDIKTEFVRNIIQITVRGASVYPAKVFAVKDGALERVFAYQYTPETVRIRLTVDGDASSYQNNLDLEPNGKMVSIHVAGKGRINDRISTSAARPMAAPSTQQTSAPSLSTSEKDRLLGKVLASGPDTKGLGKQEPLAGGKPAPSPLRAFGWLAVLLAFFGAAAFVVKKLKGFLSKRGPSSGFLAGKLKLPKKEFEVVSTQSLGPRRTRMLVRVKHRLLVLGCANDAINLITEFNEDGSESAAQPSRSGSGAMAAGAPAFADFLSTEDLVAASIDRPAPQSINRATVLKEPAAPRPQPASGAAATSASIRESIRRRVEGMKSL